MSEERIGLYRGKRTDGYGWIIGDKIVDGVTGKTYIHANGNSVNESDKVGEEGCLRFVAFEVEPESVSLCSNIPDINGNKIFEGDIVKEGDCYGIVLFGEHRLDLGFYVCWKSTSALYYRNDLLYWAPKIKVVGNMIDHKKLVENIG